MAKRIKEKGIERLMAMSSKERKEFFSETIGKEADLLNRKFENAVMSSKVDALGSWVKENLDKNYRDGVDLLLKEKFGDVSKEKMTLDKFEKTLNDGFYEDYAMRKLKIGLTQEETKEYIRMGKELYDLQQKSKSGGNDISEETSKAIFNKMRELDDYTEKLMPTDAWKQTLDTSKMFMLAAVKSAFLNTWAGVLLGGMESAGRGISARILNKSLLLNRKGFDLVDEWKKQAKDIYKDSKIDVSRMQTLDDPIFGGRRIAGERSGYVKNKPVRVIRDFVSDKLLGAPDAFFGRNSFSNSIKQFSGVIAKRTNVDQRELIKDALLLEPKTEEGKLLRSMSVLDAQTATYTDKNAVTEINRKMKDLLNDASFGARFGDVLAPYVNTVANVVKKNIEYQGVGLFTGAAKLKKGVKEDDVFERIKLLKDAYKELSTAGLGVMGAYILANTFKPEDYSPAYDPKRLDIDQLKNVAYNAVKIGGKWVSLDYFGPLAAPMNAFLMSEKYGEENTVKEVEKYIQSVGYQVSNMPLFKPYRDTLKGVVDFAEGKTDFSEIGDTAANESTQMAARLIPGIFWDVEKIIDPKKRKVDVSMDGIEVKDKRNIFGKNLYEETKLAGMEGVATQILFGARVKEDQSTPVNDELFRLRDKKLQPNLLDVQFSKSESVQQAKKVMGDKFEKYFVVFGNALERELNEIVTDENYKKLTDETKKKILDKTNDEVVKYFFGDFDREMNSVQRSEQWKSLSKTQQQEMKDRVGKSIFNQKAAIISK